MWGRIALIAGALATSAAPADELTQHLDAQRRQVEDETRPMAERERVALEMAGTLDRAAHSAKTAAERQQRWAEASALLEEFSRSHPRHPQADDFALQAAVYHWARGRTWARQAEIAPTDRRARAQAAEQLDAAIGLLRPVEAAHQKDREALAQNVRFRLAQALADRSAIEPEGSDARRQFEQDAVAVLTTPITEPALRGFADLLRADLLARLGRFDEAQSALDASVRAQPPPPADEQLVVRVAILLGRHRPDRAWAAVESAPKDDRSTELLAVRVRLEQRAETPAGPRRAELEADLFRRAEALRASNSPEGRLALLILARALKEPGEDQDPQAWDTLAEGHLLAGDADRASRLVLRGADRAQALGHLDRAGALRYRAGAILFQSGRYDQAAAVLTPIVNQARAAALRPRASLLLILARGRSHEARPTSAGLDAYVRALQAHLDTFPDDPTAAEARWRLGRVRLDAGRRDEAVSLWSAIAPEAPRWTEARLALASLLRHDVEVQLLNDDQAQIEKKIRDAQTLLSNAIMQARDPAGQDEFRLERIALQLLPKVGQPEEARQTSERLVRESDRGDLRRRARQMRIVALVELGRYLEAERDLPEAIDGSPAGERLALARRLDDVAAAADSDLVRRRVGQVLRGLAARLLEDDGELGPAEAAEARLRQVRALLFSGDPDTARRALERWPPLPAPIPEDLLRDLADTYERLDAQGLAIDAYRHLMKRYRAGTLPWFAARYGLALAYERSGQAQAARQLIEATAILHPDLGGGSLRDKFQRLRQRLGRG